MYFYFIVIIHYYILLYLLIVKYHTPYTSFINFIEYIAIFEYKNY